MWKHKELPDGITFLIKRKDLDKALAVEKEMTALTGLTVETNFYKKMVLRDVKIICVVTHWIAGNLSKYFIYMAISSQALIFYILVKVQRLSKSIFLYELSRVHCIFIVEAVGIINSIIVI